MNITQFHTKSIRDKNELNTKIQTENKKLAVTNCNKRRFDY